MKHPLALKFMTIAGLMLLLLIPITMISGIIADRQRLQANVVKDIAKSSSYNQTIIGPVLVVPYSKKVVTWRFDEISKQRLAENDYEEGELYFLPAQFDLQGQLTTESRYRGIYEATLYHADTQISGQFELPEDFGIAQNLPDYTFGEAFLSLSISDVRGIESALTVRFGDAPVTMLPGSKMPALGDGVHGLISTDLLKSGAKVPFSLSLMLQGTESIQFIPIGYESQVKLASNWQHPSFFGSHLPVSHSIDATGFVANWRTSYYSSNIGELFNACVNQNQCRSLTDRNFGVSLISPVNRYVKSDRAIKYALLFIALTFAGFLLFELLKNLSVHPVQYGLVGAALAIFYLLLISLSEHINFAVAYLVSSLACILLISFYLSYVLRGWQRSTILWSWQLFMM